LQGLSDDIALHREFVAPRSPAYARTLDLLAERIDGEFGERLGEAWREREFGPFFERPLLLLTAFRDDALREGEGHPLWPGIGTYDPDPDAVTPSALDAAAEADREHLWHSLSTRFVQTNESSRAVAWLWPAALAAAADPERPVELFDFGASAGLNLVADGLPWIWDRTDGKALDPTSLPPIAARAGYDLRPLDLLDPEDVRWLRALLWPGQHDRMERFEQGLDAYRGLSASGEIGPVEVESVDDAAAALPPHSAAGPRGLAYHSIMHDYLPDEVRDRFHAAKRAWLAASDAGAAIWVEFELTGGGDRPENAVAITVNLATGDGFDAFVIARCGPHPRVLEVDDEAVEGLREALAAN